MVTVGLTATGFELLLKPGAVHVEEVTPEAVNVLELPAQIVAGLALTGKDGVPPEVTLTVTVLGQPLEPVMVREYIPGVVMHTVDVVAPVLHENVPAPEAVSEAQLLPQIIVLPVIVTVGAGNTVMLMVLTPMHGPLPCMPDNV